MGSSLIWNCHSRTSIAGHRHQDQCCQDRHSGIRYRTDSSIGIFYHSGTDTRLTGCRKCGIPAFKSKKVKKDTYSTPCTSTLQVMDWDTPYTFILLVLERGTHAHPYWWWLKGIHHARPYCWWWKGIHHAHSYCRRWK
jgi:hypothetical protein